MSDWNGQLPARRYALAYQEFQLKMILVRVGEGRPHGFMQWVGAERPAINFNLEACRK